MRLALRLAVHGRRKAPFNRYSIAIIVVIIVITIFIATIIDIVLVFVAIFLRSAIASKLHRPQHPHRHGRAGWLVDVRGRRAVLATGFLPPAVAFVGPAFSAAELPHGGARGVPHLLA